MIKVKAARDAAPKTAPIATSAKAPGDNPAAGQTLSTIIANAEPMAALAMNIGASKPPDVPEPREIISAADLKIITANSAPNTILVFRMSEIVS